MPRLRPAAIVSQGNVFPLRGANGHNKAYKTISQQFLVDLHEYWKVGGLKVIGQAAENDPVAFFQSMIKLVAIKHVEMEVGNPGDFDAAQTKQEVMAKLEERVGPQGRKLFEKFMKQLDKMDGEVIDG